MQAQIIELTLLNHLFYFTEVSGGSTSAAITGNFIGDLALTYAFAKALSEKEDYYRYLKQPKYEEIRDFGFYCSVARPLHQNDRTEAYIQNTLFNVDGYVDITALEKSGKSPFKNYRQVQGIGIGARFHALLLSEEKLVLPKVIRVGRALETLVRVTPIKLDKKEDIDECWLNAFSLKIVFDNLNAAVALMTEKGKVNFSYILENYNLMKQFTYEEVTTLFEPIFSHG